MRSRSGLICLVLVVVSVSRLAAQESAATADSSKTRSAAELLPASTLAVAEISQPKELLTTLLEHPLRAKLEQTPGYRQALLRPQLLQLGAIVSLVETQVGVPWPKALEATVGGGVHLAFDAKTQGIALLVKAQDAVVRDKLLKTVIGLARSDAKKKSGNDPIKMDNYRGVTIYQAGPVQYGTVGAWLVLANHAELGKGIIDRALDGGAKSLAQDADYRAARSAMESSTPALWGFVRVRALRDAGALKKILRDKSDNPVAEMVLGGILSTLEKTPYATAALKLDRDQVSLKVAAPFDAGWTSKARTFYFGPSGSGVAPPLLTPKQTLLSLSTYRDVGGMWQGAADLFDENANAQLAQADSNLSNLFGGRDFGQDILGSLRPEIQIVAARQIYAPGYASSNKKSTGPDLKIPAFALAFRLKDPAKMQRQLAVSFQSIVGFLNIAGGMEKNPQLELTTTRRDGGVLLTSSYVIEPDRVNDKPIFANFSPSVAFIGDRMIVSSTQQLAEELFDTARKNGTPTTSTTGDNTRLHVDVKTVAEVVRDNRGQLVSQNMLKKGQTKAQAEKEIDGLTEIINLFSEANGRLTARDKTLELALDVQLAK